MHDTFSEDAVRARYRRETNRRHMHARDCRKPIGDCKACLANIEWFAALPLAVLSDVLSEHNRETTNA